MPLAVVVLGNTGQGFEIIGPFKTEAAAAAYVDDLNESAQIGADGAWVHELIAPEGADE